MNNKKKKFTDRLAVMALVTALAVSTSIGAGVTDVYAAETNAAEASTDAEKPAKVTGVHAYDRVDSGSMEIYWNPVADASSYQIRVSYKKKVTKKVKKGKNVVKKKTTKNITKYYTRDTKGLDDDIESGDPFKTVNVSAAFGKVYAEVRAKNANGSAGPWSSKETMRVGYEWIPEQGHYENVVKKTKETKQVPYQVTVTDKEAVTLFIPAYTMWCPYDNFLSNDNDEMGRHISEIMNSKEYHEYLENAPKDEHGCMQTEKFAHIVWFTKDHTEILEPAVTHTETRYKDVTTETEQIIGQKWVVDQAGYWEETL